MKDECIICGSPLKYLENDELMECAICHKKENSKTACEIPGDPFLREGGCCLGMQQVDCADT